MKFIALETASLGEIYHATSVYNLLQILKSGGMRLSSTLGTDAEKLDTAPFFGSFTRSKVGGYHTRVTGNFQALIVLDYDKLRQRNKLGPVDYWGREWRKNDQKINEMEERLFSNKQMLPMIDAIKAIHLLVMPDKHDEQQKVFVRRTLIEAKRIGIKIYVYNDGKFWRSMQPKKAIPISSLDLKGKEVTGTSRKRTNFLAPYLNLYYAPNKRAVTDKRAISLLRYITQEYYRDEQVRGLKADLHNLRTSEYIGKIVPLIKKHGGPEGFLEYLAKKFGEE